MRVVLNSSKRLRLVPHIARISVKIWSLSLDISESRFLRRSEIVNGLRRHPKLDVWQLLRLFWPFFDLRLAPEARVVALDGSCLLRGRDCLHIGYRLT